MNFDYDVPKVPVHNIPALVQIMAIVIVIVWTNDGYFTDAFMSHTATMS